MKVTIEISARHIHLCTKDLKTLFGTTEMPVRNRLSQKGEFASDYTVEIVGPKNRIKKVRVLGPIRDVSQLELSRTDSFVLGINAPLANSGSGIGDKIRVIGLKSEITEDIAMISRRHFHSSPSFAKRHSLKDGQIVKMHIPGNRAITLENILVRIKEGFSDVVHIDTDEANSADLYGISYGQLIKDRR